MSLTMPFAAIGRAAIRRSGNLGASAVSLFLATLKIARPKQVPKIIQQVYFIGARSTMIIMLVGLFTGMVMGRILARWWLYANPFPDPPFNPCVRVSRTRNLRADRDIRFENPRRLPFLPGLCHDFRRRSEGKSEVLRRVGWTGILSFQQGLRSRCVSSGSYSFQDFTDDISGTRDGVPVTAALKVKKLWDVNFGIGVQATLSRDIKPYAGPYLYYSQAKISSSGNIPGLPFPTGEVTAHNKTNVGGFAGIDVPLARGFHLLVEGRYSDRFSGGTTVAYSY